MGRPNGGELHALQRRRKFGSRRVMKRGSVPNERHQKKKFDEHVTGQNVGRYIIGEEVDAVAELLIMKELLKEP